MENFCQLEEYSWLEIKGASSLRISEDIHFAARLEIKV